MSQKNTSDMIAKSKTNKDEAKEMLKQCECKSECHEAQASKEFIEGVSSSLGQAFVTGIIAATTGVIIS